MNKQHPMGWFNFDFSQSVMDAVQDLRSPANRIGFPPTRGCRTTPASCPQNLRSGSSRKTGSRQIGISPTSSAQNEIPYVGIGTYVRLGPLFALWGSPKGGFVGNSGGLRLEIHARCHTMAANGPSKSLFNKRQVATVPAWQALKEHISSASCGWPATRGNLIWKPDFLES